MSFACGSNSNSNRCSAPPAPFATLDNTGLDTESRSLSVINGGLECLECTSPHSVDGDAVLSAEVSHNNEARDPTSEQPELVPHADESSRCISAVFKRLGLKWTVPVFALVAALLAFLRGFTLVYSSSAVLDLTGEAEDLPESYLFSTTLISMFVALSAVGASLGAPAGGYMADRLGRKWSMILAGGPFFLGYSILSFAHYSQTASTFKALMLLGKFIAGVGMGWGSALFSVYIAEISPVKQRGVFCSFSEVMVTLGIITSFGVGSIQNFRYYHLSLVAVGIVIVFELSMIWLPETPFFLLYRGHEKKAEHSLRLLRRKNSNVESELSGIKEFVHSTRAAGNKKEFWRLFLKKRVFVPFLYVLVLVGLIQIGGLTALVSYAGPIFTSAGISNPRTTAEYAIGVAMLVGNIVSLFTVDLLGRKLLLIMSSLGMCTGFLLLGTHFYITRPSLCLTISLNPMLLPMNEQPCNTHFSPLAIFSLFLCLFSCSVGWCPLMWVLLSELLPLSVRGFASGSAMFLNAATAAAVNASFLKYAELVNPWFAMWVFAGINFTGALFVVVFIPETKGKSLEEVEKWFRQNTVSLLSTCKSPQED